MDLSKVNVNMVDDELIERMEFVIYNYYYNDETICRECGRIGKSAHGEKEDKPTVTSSPSAEIPPIKNDANGDKKIPSHYCCLITVDEDTKMDARILFNFHTTESPFIHLEGIANIKSKIRIEDDSMEKKVMDSVLNALLPRIKKIGDSIHN